MLVGTRKCDRTVHGRYTDGKTKSRRRLLFDNFAEKKRTEDVIEQYMGDTLTEKPRTEDDFCLIILLTKRFND